MEDFKHRRKKLEFWSRTGEVLGSSKYSETQVWSTGGGGSGYVHPQHGGRINVSAPQVHSRSITHHEFWMNTPDGREHSVKLANKDIPLREGQKITLISCGRKGKRSGYYTILVNHSAGKHWFINTANDLNRLFGLERVTGVSVLLAVVVLFAVAFLTVDPWPPAAWIHIFKYLSLSRIWEIMRDQASWKIAGIAAGVVFAYRVVRKLVRLSRLKSRLTQQLRTLAQDAYSAVRKA